MKMKQLYVTALPDWMLRSKGFSTSTMSMPQPELWLKS